ncbi:MAG: ABC-F family ATP-binding cassette domain-containing protein [Ferruginibacter sp.]|nr:ABC-F family ATP-binding cassette domain-containing protein [Ferruginibacter sp.]
MLLGLQNATFEFGARTIFENATWHIQPNERIGLIGYNGTGKSTLLKVLTGQYSLSAGTVEKGRETTIGFLHQDLLSFDTEDSILQVAMGAFERVLQIEKELEDLAKELETNPTDELGIKYADLLHEMDVLDGYSVHHKTEEILQGLGFSNADVHRPYKEFSGGWRMRVLLAKMILMAPDVLLLDEPTNHLDLPSIEWLEKYLIHYKGSVVIVSHDRFFLDRMVNKIVEIYQQELHIYSGNYTYYQTEKAVRIEMQKRAFENQQDYIRQQERVVERFKAKASKAAMAQSIIKKLDKIERIEDTNLERPNIKINFSIDKQPGKVLCTVKDISKSFGTTKIVQNTGAEINRGDKIALIGANGKGKSTLLRIVAGVEPFEGGERVWGHNVVDAFYAQHQLEALNIENPILEEMERAGSGKTTLELRTLMGCFLFGGDDIDKKIKVLSGGEKARVALAKTIVSKANFLLLDEPTNHLDMHSVELLIEALNKYEGSFILVSHDRYFVSKTANKIWEIDNYEIKEFNGGYDEWMEWKERQAANAVAGDKVNSVNKVEKVNKVIETVVTPTETPKPQTAQPIDKELKKELQKHKNRFTQLEDKIAAITKTKADLEAQLAQPDVLADRTKFVVAEKAYNDAVLELTILNGEYETVFEKVMELEEKMG